MSSRSFPIAAEALYEAFRDPALLARWWGPKGFSNTFHDFSFRPGGDWRLTMRGPDGKTSDIHKRFAEIVPFERIVLDNIDPNHAFRMTIAFAPASGGALMTWRMEFPPASANEKLRDFLLAANEENFDRLEALLASQHAPPEALICDALRSDDAPAVRRLLEQNPELRARLNEALPVSGGPAITHARSVAMVDALADAGADLNAKTNWWAGGFGLLHLAPPDVALHAVQRGAQVDIHAAARLGLADKVREWLRADSHLVHARGGDGQTPLHFASTIEIAQLLLDHGADINARDIDHESTPIQHMIKDRQEIARWLLSRGAQADIFIAAALGDQELAVREIANNPDVLRLRVSGEFFPMVGERSGGTIYQWTLGWHVSPHQVARQFGHTELYQWLLARSPADVRFVNACWLADEPLAREILKENPALPKNLGPADLKQVAHAARNNQPAVVALMLKLGWPVTARGQHNATVLHWACWHGNLPMIETVLSHSPDLNAHDSDFNSTPVGWAIHASEHGWNSPGSDYVAALKLLFKAGAEKPPGISGSPSVCRFLASAA